ncbi:MULTISPECIES: RHS repeat-associated core domain-containing protein [Pseudomonas]|uniref:RHS repeat-associated core domain-containing protein n=1 Tax=Pseudomonas TaxID=286 RepID=UPI001CB90AD9|nr:RHS repeat-associated core domain-containing protein [Pseudomonas putida]MBM7395798.1 RHS repeat-associated protein [Pseudomonas sp. M5]
MNDLDRKQTPAPDGGETCKITYSPYGSCAIVQRAPMIGFVGQKLDPASGFYPLGDGHRWYAPPIRRFTSPDALSPFGVGGLNAYAYCAGDPVNYIDPDGRNRYGPWAAARLERHQRDVVTLKAAKFPQSLRPQLEHLRQQVKKGFVDSNPHTEVHVATLYKRSDPHNAYGRWNLHYKGSNDSFSLEFMFGNPIEFLPSGRYQLTKNVYMSAMNNVELKKGLPNYRSYRVRAEDLESFALPASQHVRAPLPFTQYVKYAHKRKHPISDSPEVPARRHLTARSGF